VFFLQTAISFTCYNSTPGNSVLEGIAELHNKIFGDASQLVEQMKHKPQLLVNVAWDENKVIGYKIGYSMDFEKYYSWLGGVDPVYRNLGIASKLLEEQHRYLKKAGYKAVQTKTKNKWRSMLILNLKYGFDIIGTYTDEDGEPKIILQKNLNES
jgi:ribosomal protein S18 acetylase RimI-like enzyme